MAVVIHDFEVIPEAPAAQATGASAPPPAPVAALAEPEPALAAALAREQRVREY